MESSWLESSWLESPWLEAPELEPLPLPLLVVLAIAALLTLLVTVEWGRVTAMATAPTVPAAPALRVRADTQASPLLRVRFLFSWSMPQRSGSSLCGLWVLPLNRL